jgi:lipid II:glycine glycyltransferase (peptidoglycan interpeptide bridge formation enzyme)
MTTVRQCYDKTEWDDYVLDHQGHPLQLWGWGSVKSKHAWRVERIFIEDESRIIGAAQLLIRPLPSIFRSLVYVPRGPIAVPDQRKAVLAAIKTYVERTHKPVAVTIEPDWGEMQPLSEWKVSKNTILIPRTIILDLAQSEEQLLSATKKKTRQYIRKSGSDGVRVRRATSREDIAACLEIYKQTARRAQFRLHGDQYYYDIYDELGEYSPVFVAECEGEIIAFLWPVISASTAFELYGGMNDKGQLLRANYILKWKVITQMKEWGIERYDMNGLLNDGVSMFKQSFASHEDMLVGTYDATSRPLLYKGWAQGLPYAKNIVRTLRKR